MSADQIPRRSFPCRECPWQVTAEPGKFPTERYEKLRTTCRPNAAGIPPLPGTPMFGCHLGNPGTGEDLACAGWLAVEGFEHIGVRLALRDGLIPASAMQPGDNWPELYPSYEALIEANRAMTGKDVP